MALHKREQLALLEFGNKQELDLMVEVYPNLKKLITQVRLIRFTSEMQLKRYIALQRLQKEAEKLFFKYAPFALLVDYVHHYQIENGQELLISRSTVKDILLYLSKHKLCTKGEKLLLSRGNHSEIKAYIKANTLDPDNEVAFVKRGKHREIMLYLSKTWLR